MKQRVINELDLQKGMLTKAHSEAIGSRDEVILSAYEMAGNYYHSTAFRHSIESKEDFIMEVATCVAEMYDSGEIHKNISKEELGALIKSNIFNKIRREFRVEVPHRRFDNQVSGSDNYKHTTDLDLFESSEGDFGYIKNPEEQYNENLNNQIIYGKGKEYAESLLNELIKKFSNKPYTGRRYKYVLPTGARMSPQVLARMSLEGKSLQDTVDLFMPKTDINGNPVSEYVTTYLDSKYTYTSHTSPGTYIRNNVHKIRRALEDEISALPEDDRKILYAYVQEKFYE